MNLLTVTALRIACLSLVSLLTFTVLTVGIKPNVDTDIAYGTLKTFKKTGQFHTLQHVDSLQIANDREYYLSWWTPGQVVLPAVMNQITQVPLHRCESVLTVICVLIGLCGLWRLYQKLQFSTLVSFCALLLVIMSPDFGRFFMMYGAGDLLLFAYLPWFFLYVLSIRELRISAVLLLGVLTLLGVFLKSASLVLFLAANLYLLFRQAPSARKNPAPFMRGATVLGIFGVLTLCLSKMVIIGPHETPVSTLSTEFPLHHYNPSPLSDYLFSAL